MNPTRFALGRLSLGPFIPCFATIAALSGCSGSSADPGLPSSGGSFGLPGVGGQTVGGATVGQGGTTTKGGSTSSPQGGNGAAAVGGATNAGGVPNGGTVNRGGGTATGGATAGGAISGGASSGGNKATGGSVTTGGKATGGVTTGGNKATGGLSTGGNKATGGNSTGGVATGGRVATGGASTGGVTSTGGTPATGGTTSTGSVFSQCRFHFGTGDWNVLTGGSNKGYTAIIPQIDYFTSGWLLAYSNFSHGDICTRSAPGGVLAGKLPVMMAYAAADYVKRNHSLCDCNVSGCSGGDLCRYGAQYISQDWANILAVYRMYANGFANCMAGRPIVFAMEPDWYQYTISGQTQPWTAAQAGTNMTALVNALKSNTALKAYFSMDISPWIPNNGSDWFRNFDMSLFTFISTSGGGTDAGDVNGKIRSRDTMTWRGVNQVTGKPILADTGYGAAGAPTGEDSAWNLPTNINSRIADGVIGICQYSPNSNWGTTISNIRSQLNAPKYCP